MSAIDKKTQTSNYDFSLYIPLTPGMSNFFKIFFPLDKILNSNEKITNKKAYNFSVARIPISVSQGFLKILTKVDLVFSKWAKIINISKGLSIGLSAATDSLANVLYFLEAIIIILRIEQLIKFSKDMVFFKKDFLKAKTPKKKMEKISSLITHLESNKKTLTTLWGKDKFSRILNNLQNIKTDKTDEKVENFFNKLIAIDLASKLQNFKTRRLDWDEKNNTEEKTKNLKHLIRPFAVKELKNAFFNKNLIEKLKSQDSETQLQAIKEAENLIGMMKTQYQKALVIHFVSLISLGIMAAGTTTGLVLLFACPQASFLILALPHIIYYTGWAIEFSKWYLTAGLLDHKGWKYDVNQGIYTPIKNSIKEVEKAFEKTFDISKKTITYAKENPVVTLSMTGIGVMGSLVIASTLKLK